eukprot:TRINITY_DN1922_c1_g1_i1.p1 TRINITY_DN1922_c1_g1~~TRINITY_DN1922_c1_g1_i1.p1  ORF type:complete len:314 (+),score=120.05 TRINITY_DN1922_c1_g1_i1:153-1094(+)
MDAAALAAEFDEVTRLRDANRAEAGKIPETDPNFAMIHYKTAYMQLRNHAKADDSTSWKHYQAKLEEEGHPHAGGSGCFSWFQTNVAEKYIDDRDFVFCITTNVNGRAHLAVDYSVALHSRLVGSVYKRLTDKPPHASVPPVGPHWEQLGFQGPNFNNCSGRLGSLFVFLQMLSFIDHAPRLANETFRESRPPTMRPFRWALWSIFASTCAIDAFSKKKLNKYINSAGVMQTLNDFYLGVFAETFRIWCEAEKREEMHHFNEIKQHVTAWALKDPNAVLKRAKLALLESKDQHQKPEVGPMLDLSKFEEEKKR